MKISTMENKGTFIDYLCSESETGDSIEYSIDEDIVSHALKNAW